MPVTLPDDESNNPPSPARYGPFHRLESDTQATGTAAEQVASQEIWGRAPRDSSWPQVQAYRGTLPAGSRGIEFYTDVAPDPSHHPFEARWSGGGLRTEVKTDGEFAKIGCVITKNTQSDAS